MGVTFAGESVADAGRWSSRAIGHCGTLRAALGLPLYAGQTHREAQTSDGPPRFHRTTATGKSGTPPGAWVTGLCKPLVSAFTRSLM